MQSETVVLANSALSGEWHHGNARHRLIIVCHGYQGSSADPSIIAITDDLNRLGHDTFTFDFSKNASDFDIEHQVQDIKQIAGRFKEYDELILLAASFAALTATIATVKLVAIKRLITVNGFFGTGDLGREHRKTYIKFRLAAVIIPQYRRILKYFQCELRPELITVPVLHSKVDAQVFIAQSLNFYRQLSCPKRFVELENANHGITLPTDRQRVVAEIHQWLQGKN